MNKETEFLWAIKHGTTSKTFLIAPMTDHCPLWVLPTYVFRDDKLAEQQLREMKLESPNRYVNFDTSEIVPVVVEVREISKEEMAAHQKEAAKQVREFEKELMSKTMKP